MRVLVAAAVRAGGRRVLAQSIAWGYAPGPEPHLEGDPLDMGAEGNRRVTVQAVAELERLVASVPRLDGLVLPYGCLYGAGTWNAGPSGNAPVHVHAAARAAVPAVTRGQPGIYNIVEDGAAASNAKARAGLRWDPGLR